MSRLSDLFARKSQGILSIFFTAGYPRLEDTRSIIRALAQSGVDLIEIGMPFSDPIADGGTIQMSSQQALHNGITLERIFAQLEGIREETDIPLILMGYVNPVLQYGMDAFVKKAASLGIDGVILPDLPLAEYQAQYRELMESEGIANIFLITPQTAPSRVQQMDQASRGGFLYLVSSASTTGSTSGFGAEQEAYFHRIQEMKLSSPTLIGFGIHDHASFQLASRYAQGAIIGSAFIQALGDGEHLAERIEGFVGRIREGD